MVAGAEFKRQVPPIAKLGPRTAGVDYLYPRRRPGSPAAASTRLSAAGGTLYVVATPIGNLGDVTLRALEVLRAVPLIAAEDTRVTPAAARPLRDHRRGRPATTRGAARPGARRCSSTSRAGADLALVTDAGTPVVSDPGDELVARVGRRRAASSCPCPGASAVLAAVVGVRASPGPRWCFEGFLPRTGRERRERLAADRRRRAGDGPLRGAEPARGDAARPRGGVRRRPAGGRLPGADEAPRADRARDARRPRRARGATARSRRAASSSSSSGWGSGGRRDAARPAAAERRAGGRAGRGRAARRGRRGRGARPPDASPRRPGSRAARLYGAPDGR